MQFATPEDMEEFELALDAIRDLFGYPQPPRRQKKRDEALHKQKDNDNG